MSSYESKQLTEVFGDISCNKLVLPSFQRGFVWSEDNQKGLLASVLVNLNFGVALIIDGSRSKFAVRTIGSEGYIPVDSLKEDVWYLLDGQQRITTLYSTFNTVWSKPATDFDFNKVFLGLQRVWFVRLQSPEDRDASSDTLEPGERIRSVIRDFCEQREIEDDVFGFEHLNFNEDQVTRINSDVMENYLFSKKVSAKSNDIFNYAKLFSSERRTEIVRFCVENKCVPLFWIMNDKIYSSSFKKILDEISSARLEQIIQGFEKAPADMRYDIFTALMPMDDEEYIKYAEEIKKGNYSQDVLKQTYSESIRNCLGSRWKENIALFFKQLRSRNINFLHLDRSEFDRSINIFSTLNEGGTPLGLFDLVVARTALLNEDGKTNETIEDIFKREIEKPINCLKDGESIAFVPSTMKLVDKKVVNKSVAEQIFMVNLIGCLQNYLFNSDFSRLLDLKKGKFNPKDILNRKFSPMEVRRFFAIGLMGFLRTMTFLNTYIGLENYKSIQYTKMITPLTLCLMQDSVWKNEKQLRKIEGWYWYTILSGGYKSGRDLALQSFHDIFNLANLLGLADSERVKGKLGSYYEHCVERMQPGKAHECQVLNAVEYSDFKTISSGKINKKLENTIKQLLQCSFLSPKLFDSAMKGNEMDFESFKNECCQYIRECLGMDTGA